MTPRAWLFVPGDRPDRMEKALTCGADALILDLEDSVTETAKSAARAAVHAFLRRRAGAGGPQLWVRINALSTPHGLTDLESTVAAGPCGIVLPKCESAADVLDLSAHLAGLEGQSGLSAPIRILPIVTETPRSIFNLGTYAEAPQRLAGLTWGAEDLSCAVGALSARREDGGLAPLYELARSLCLAGAAAAGVEAIETVYPDIRDLAGLAAYAVRGRRDGFTSMMAIHPAQVGVINDAFTPSAEEMAWARTVVGAFAASPTAGALSLEGRMIDAPHLRQAQKILDRGSWPDGRP